LAAKPSAVAAPTMNADGLSAPILLGLANGLLQNAEERMPVLRMGERRVGQAGQDARQKQGGLRFAH